MGNSKKPISIVPEGLAVYPHNKLWALLITIATLMGISDITTLILKADKKQT